MSVIVQFLQLFLIYWIQQLTGYFFGQGAKSSAEHGIFSSEDEAEGSENKEDESAGIERNHLFH